MSILRTAYQTLTLTGVSLDATRAAVITAVNAGKLFPVDEDFPLIPIVRNNGPVGDIPVFNHPLLVSDGG